MKLLITGGCGFIGSNLTRKLVREEGASVVNVDKLTYAGRRENLADLEGDACYELVVGDMVCAETMRRAFADHAPDAVIHLAAESHVDRSIDEPTDFFQTNAAGTFMLLQAALEYFEALPSDRQEHFRFIQVSTDEVYGALNADDPPVAEAGAYSPRSPYAASKAAADHMAQAWWETYGLPVIRTHSTNNFGPWQFPEKFIPTVILKALAQEPIPIYGRGENVRDWLHVADHCAALIAIIQRGRIGDVYHIGASNEWRNIDLAKELCRLLDEQTVAPAGGYESLIEFVEDRPGHDFRYALDASKIRQELGWRPSSTAAGFGATVAWYLDHGDWRRSLAADALKRRGLRERNSA